jgi:hypothetical protein
MSITSTTNPSLATTPRSAAPAHPASAGTRRRRTIPLGLGTAGVVAAALVAVAMRPAAPAAPAAPIAPASTTLTGAVGARTGGQAVEHAYGRSALTDGSTTLIVPPVTASNPFAPIGPIGASPAVRHYGTARATRLESTQTTASQPTARQVRGIQQLNGAFRYGRGYEQ